MFAQPLETCKTYFLALTHFLGMNNESDVVLRVEQICELRCFPYFEIFNTGPGAT